MKKFKKTNAKPLKARIISRHSQLLALEPRQVFDAAVGAAIAEVLAAPVENETSDYQSEIEIYNWREEIEITQETNDYADLLAAGASDGQTGLSRVNGEIAAFADTSGNPPVLSVVGGSASAMSNETFSLAGIQISDPDAGELHSLLLKPSAGGKLSGPSDIAGVTLSPDGKSLQFTDMTVEQINAALAQYSFSFEGQSGKATILYTLTDPVTRPVDYYFEINFEYFNTPPDLNVDWA